MSLFIRYILFLGLCTSCTMNDSPILWKQLEAPGGLISVSYDEPPAYGSHTLHFSYLPQGASAAIDLGHFELNNDGMLLSDSNLVAEYGPDQLLRITLRGQQQKDRVLVFDQVINYK